MNLLIIGLWALRERKQSLAKQLPDFCLGWFDGLTEIKSPIKDIDSEVRELIPVINVWVWGAMKYPSGDGKQVY